MKTNQISLFDDSVRILLENSIEVTIENRVLLFDLNSKRPQPIADQGAVDQLLDPQNYVEFGV